MLTPFVDTTYLELLKDSVFIEKPEKLHVRSGVSSQYASLQKVEVLIQELKNRGALIGLGNVGFITSQNESSIYAYSLLNKDIYTWNWNPGMSEVKHNQDTTNISIMVLGAKKMKTQAYVYFTVAKEIKKTKGRTRKYIPSSENPRIYVLTYDTFKNCVPHLDMPVLPRAKQKYVDKLCNLGTCDYFTVCGFDQLAYIELKRNFREIGQEIFNKFQTRTDRDYLEGMKALREVIRGVFATASDPFYRVFCIKKAWLGLGR